MSWFDRIEFLLTEAFVALRRNTWMSFAAITTAAMALFLLGGLTLVYENAQAAANRIGDQFEMRVFIKDGTPLKEARQTVRDIRQVAGVETAVMIPKDAAWKQFQTRFPDMVQGLDNPLPDEIKVRVTDLKRVPELAAEIQAMEAVEPKGVQYLDDQRTMVTESLKTLRWAGIALGGLMLITSAILIYNAIRMTIVARAREIRVMQMVGATQFTVLMPMGIEGILQGALGGAVAAGLLTLCHVGVQNFLAKMSVQAQLINYSWSQSLVTLIVAGAIYGALCSLLAVRDPRLARR